MVSFLSNRQCTIAALVVLLILFMALQPSLSPAHAQPAPTITLNPTEGPPGTEVTATGSGWPQGHEIKVRWDTPDNTDIAATAVDSNGGFTVSFTVPDDGAEGQHTVYFVGVPPDGGEYANYAIFTLSPVIIPSLNARVTALRFYESGNEFLPPEERVYAQRFGSDTSRYINWVLDLAHPAPGRRVDFKITAIYLRDNGPGSWEEFFRQTLDAYVEGDWASSYHGWSYGFDEPGNWEIGSYSVELHVEGKKIANEQFEIY
jgi:hypothetical protein